MKESYESEGCSVRVDMQKGLVFLHVDIHNWAPSTVRGLRKLGQEVREDAIRAGHDVVFGCSDQERIVKLWKMMEPWYRLDQLEDDSWLVSWLTEEI